MFVEYVFQVSAFPRPGHYFIDVHVIIDVSWFSGLILWLHGKFTGNIATIHI